MTVGMGFEESVRTYWQITPSTPRPLAEHFIEHVLSAEDRTSEWFRAIGVDAASSGRGLWLDLGCGTADLAAAAGGQGVVSIDIALRWLVVARKRPGLREAGDFLICANAEHLPLPDSSFDGVFSLGMLEHCADPRPILQEAKRVLRGQGIIHARTTNRFSLLSEPHVNVWGVGFVPRSRADSFVKWRSGQRYLHHRPLSAGELRREMKSAGFNQGQVLPGYLLSGERARLGRMGHLAGGVYQRLRNNPVASRVLAAVAPILDFHAVKA